MLFGDRRWPDYNLDPGATDERGGEVNTLVRATLAAPGKTAPDQWYKLKVEVRGKTCRLFLDGKLLVTHDAVPSPSGQVGLRTVGTAARFRNIKVTDPAGKVLFEGLPSLPGARDK